MLSRHDGDDDVPNRSARSAVEQPVLTFFCVSLGPIQKLTVPDFQHITNVYDKLQSEGLDKPAKARLVQTRGLKLSDGRPENLL